MAMHLLLIQEALFSIAPLQQASAILLRGGCFAFLGWLVSGTISARAHTDDSNLSTNNLW